MSNINSDSEILSTPESLTPVLPELNSTEPSYPSVDDQQSLNDVSLDSGLDSNLASDPGTEFTNTQGDDSAVRAEVASPNNMGIDDTLVSNDSLGTDLNSGLGTDLENEDAISPEVASPSMGSDDTLVSNDVGTDTELVTGTDTGLAESGSLETNSSNKTSITIEITKDKLDELLTKISEETINYLSLLIKFLEKKTQLDTNDKKINKTIQELTQIKDNAIKVLTENDITSNSFDPSSTAQKSQYAEMIMAALGLAVSVTGGKISKSKSKKRVKKHKKTQHIENKNYNHKSKKYRRKKGKTKGQMDKIKNDEENKESK
jgi:hypothetical protein